MFISGMSDVFHAVTPGLFASKVAITHEIC
jgi:hypothetical protein